MNQKSYQALTAMLNAFPQSSADIRALLLTYEQALTGIGDRAIEDVARRFIAGDVSGQNTTFAPSIAEFKKAAVARQEVIDIEATPRLPPPVRRSGLLAPFQVKQQKALAENANREVLHEGVSLDMWKRLSSEKSIPVGAIWVASLGIVFGPVPK